jgi:hypothetical protein
MPTFNTLEVGSIVRAPRPQHPKTTGRAMVATVLDKTSVELLWESVAPKPIHKSSKSKKRFLVAPKFSKESEDEEFTIGTEQLQELLPFEETSTEEVPENDSIGLFKDRGDQLLRLGDASSAASYYEVALAKSSHVSIGGTVVVPIKGFPKIAEVDCVEEDMVDVTIVDTGDEATIRISEVLISILEPDPDKLQERILLNLARCMLQLSDIDGRNKPKYLKSAVLACTLAMTLSSFHDDEDGDPITVNAQTALILRVKAQSGLSKWRNAMADAKRLDKAGNGQGRKLLDSIERQKKQQVKKDKKLSKAVAQWVSTATSESVSETIPELPSSTSTQTANELPEVKNETQQSLIASPMFIILALLAAFLIQKIPWNTEVVE